MLEIQKLIVVAQCLSRQLNKGFLANLVITFKNFGIGIFKLFSLHRQ